MQKYTFLLLYANNLVPICDFFCTFAPVMRNMVCLYALYALISLSCCSQKKQQEVTPWGTPVEEVEGNEDNVNEASDAESQVSKKNKGFSLEDIQDNGEMIMLTVNGPTTYYDYHNHGMGLQYLLCEKFAEQIGVSLRVEECKDTAEMVSKLQRGEGDVIAVPLPRKTTIGKLLFCGVTPDDAKTQWAVAEGNHSLADTLNAWFKPQMIAQVKKEESWLLSSRSVTRHVYSPFLNRSKGVISKYDHLFQRYSGMARMDWRLMAAQCYQESCFDLNAKSWAGACGLMQIMPSTAAHLGLSMSMIHDPEANIAASARYMSELQEHFSDVGDPMQRMLFALASYNGGYFHIRDAMSLARKHGANPQHWTVVRDYVLRLSQPTYYCDPVVKHGYMRGTETVDYVDRIQARWNEYSGGASFSGSYRGRGMGSSSFHGAPVRSKRHYQGKYHI